MKNQAELPEGWQTKNISHVLERASEPVKPVAEVTYREIGIRSHGKGIFHKEPVTGKDLGNKRVFNVIPNCFVVNIVFAWEQAVAKTTEAEEGMIASHRFPQFKPRNNQCDIDYILYLFKTQYGKYLLGLASPGGAGRNKTLGQKEFDRIKITLPPLTEQIKIAQILSIWDKAIETVEALIVNSEQQKKATKQMFLTGKVRFPKFDNSWNEYRLGEITEINPRKPKKPEDGKVSFIPMEAVSNDARIIKKYEKYYEEVDKGFTAFCDSDVLVAKITPCFENGKGGCPSGLTNGIGFGSTEFHVLRAKKKILPHYLYYLINSSEFRARGTANMQGTAGHKRVPVDYIRIYKFKIPESLKEQKRIVEFLSNIDGEIETLKQQKKLLMLEKSALMQQLLTGKCRVSV